MKIPRRLLDISGYALCVLMCQFSLVSASGVIASLMYKGGSMVGVHYASRPDAFYANNWLWFNLSAGTFVGFLANGAWRSRFSWFVWVPSGVWLLHRIIVQPRSAIFGNAGDSLVYFLSAGCKEISLDAFYISVRCADQYHYSLPFYAAIGFSFGAWLRDVHLTLSRPKSE